MSIETKGDELRAAVEGQMVEATVGSLASTPARGVAVGGLWHWRAVNRKTAGSDFGF